MMIDSLKNQLRASGFTFAQVAKLLNVSESTIKRAFSKRNLTMERYFQICEVCNIDPSDLFKFENATSKKHILSKEQDYYFYKNPKAFPFMMGLLKKETPKGLAKKYALSEPVKIKFLRALDRLKLIEWGPKDKIKILVDWISLRPNGLFSKVYTLQISKKFIEGDFKGDLSIRYFSMPSLTESSKIKILAELTKLREKIRVESQISSASKEKKEETGIFVAMKPFESSE